MNVSVINLILMSLISILLWKFTNPYERGFDCNDKSIFRPYYPIAIRMPYLLSFALIIPISFITFNEFYYLKSTSKSIYLKLKQYYFGLVFTFILVLISKVYFGRLRPNAIEGICSAKHYCQPNSTYIPHFVCNNPIPKLVKESRMSFYSGHSSVGTYSAIYLILYFYYRFKTNKNSLLLFQIMVFTIGLIPGLTQGINYWHHWSDIFTGYSVGAITAYLVINFV